MAEGKEPYVLLESSKASIINLTNKIILKYLIAEVARLNRSPEEASDFVNKFRSHLDSLNSAINPEPMADIDLAWYTEMNSYIEGVFEGISFKESNR